MQNKEISCFPSTYALSQVDETGGSGHEEDGLPVRDTVEAELPEGHVELQHVLGDRRDLVREALEGLLELVPQLSLSLLGREVVAVVHVLVLAQVGGDLAHLGVELHVGLLLLAKHDRMLGEEKKNRNCFGS